MSARNMQNGSWISVAFLLVLWSCAPASKLKELRAFAPTETLPEDSFLDSVSTKRAMVIVAHDDDDCGMAGTIAKLSSNGWEVLQLSLVVHNPSNMPHPAEHICKGNILILEDGLYRVGLDTNRAPYLPMPLAEFPRQFLRDKVADALMQKVNAFEPSVIFTLDNVKGGYGHPEHIFVSQLVLDLHEEGRITPQRIYQSVYTDHMERTIVDTWLRDRMRAWGHPHASYLANQLYGIDGMPDPTVQVTITGQERAKMTYLRSYPKDAKKNMRKFIPYFDEVNAKTYFEIFDREFFRVIE